MNATVTLYQCAGGTIVLPPAELVLVDREDGGNLLINPPRPVWERSILAREELAAWAYLVAAAGAAMLSELPQLEDGCINYWEAGNWALNDAAPPPGPKSARGFRSAHMHLLGRSPRARSWYLKWGEAPNFPNYADRLTRARAHAPLTADECSRIVARTDLTLSEKYEMDQRAQWSRCAGCSYPIATGMPHECIA